MPDWCKPKQVAPAKTAQHLSILSTVFLKKPIWTQICTRESLRDGLRRKDHCF